MLILPTYKSPKTAITPDWRRRTQLPSVHDDLHVHKSNLRTLLDTGDQGSAEPLRIFQQYLFLSPKEIILS